MIDFLGSLLVIVAITFAACALIIVSGNALLGGGVDGD
jgi:hypothetical protein